MMAPKTQTRSHCRGVVEASFVHLLGLVRDNGRFVYAHRAGRPDVMLDGYNMLRHCGTLWFMLRALNELALPLAPAGRAALDRAVAYATGKFERPMWIPEPSLALVTKGAVKTGGIGLALVMLEEYRRACQHGLPDAGLPGPHDMIPCLQTYALAQIADNDFLHKRLITDGTVLPFRSAFYTGEVLLGLLVTGCSDPKLVATTEALIARRYGVAEQSHWMAYAACEAAARGLVDAGRIADYLADLITAIIEDDSYLDRRMSTPIACRAEALTRFVRLCDQMPGQFPPALRAAALRVAERNMALQLGWYADGQFWKGDTDDKVQIDYIQHNATAFLNRWHID